MAARARVDLHPRSSVDVRVAACAADRTQHIGLKARSSVPLETLVTPGGRGSRGRRCRLSFRAAPSMVGVAVHFSHEARAATGAFRITHSELITGFSVSRGHRNRPPAAGARRIGTGCAGCRPGFVQWNVTGDCVSLRLRHVRRAIDLGRACSVSRVDRPAYRVGEGSRVAVLDALEHDLVSLYELIGFHAQMGCRGMPD
jgi:hypothetical protein